MQRTLLTVTLTTLLATSVHPGTIAFQAVSVPTSDETKRQVRVSPTATVDGKTIDIGYHTILRSGDDVNGQVFGQIIDRNADPIQAVDGSTFISNGNDFSSLLSTKSGKLFMVSHFESRPAVMYLTELSQQPAGELVATRTRPLDFSRIRGGWVHCAGSVTPWGTHLGSEEYEPDARQWRDKDVDDDIAKMARYFGSDPANAITVVNPYDYGYPIEVEVAEFDDVTGGKHYAMGRMALELAYVMPDKRTAYMSDDGTSVGLYRFVADRAGDLSAGTLHAARWIQTADEGLGAARLEWIDLGHATDAQVNGWIRGDGEHPGYAFADIFDAPTPIDDVCSDGYTSINAGHESAEHQCLRLKDVNGDGHIDATDQAIASRLETRRWAAMQGATTEWRKMEGITFDPEARKLYLAMSQIAKGMENNTGSDTGGPNSIKLTQNTCGGVYELDVDANSVATQMTGLLAGTPRTYPDDSPYAGNTCDVEGLANPDNLTFMPGYRTLIIGEDTGSGHQNDAMWAYNLDDKTLTRIETTPYGSETTSPYFYPNINGYAYLMSVVQHPYGESDEDKLENPSQARAYTGFIGPFPAMD